MADASEKDKFKKQVDLFVAYHRKKQSQKEKANKRNNFSLDEVVERAPNLTDEAIDLLIDKDQDYPVTDQVLREVELTLKKMQHSINRMDPKRRFFILDTVNFFSSKIGIAKLIPALLVLKGEDQKKAIAEFVFPTFFSIQKNVETLLGNQAIFKEDRVHIEKGELYLIVADIARIIVCLFKKDFMEEVSNGQNAVEFLTSTFHPTTLKFNQANKNGTEYVYQEMIDKEADIRRIVLKFIVTIQAHESLYTYSIKRYEHYKAFLTSLVVENRFKGVDAIDISKILAGCFLANDQLKPDEELIESMIDDTLFNDEETAAMTKSFIDNISPGNIYKLISRLKVSLQHISNTNFSQEFQEIQKFSVKSILKTAWSGFISLVEKGLSVVTEPIKAIYQQVKRTYESFIYDERQKEEQVKSGMIETSSESTVKSTLIPKDIDSFSHMSQHFQLVETDVISFRGEHDGATFKDFGYNSQFFLKNEATMLKFLECFKTLFSVLEKDSKVKVISYEGYRGITEYYAVYSFAYYLFCFGLTHIKNPQLPVIEEKSIFPYIFVLMESNAKKEGRINSRRVKNNKKNKWVYNEMTLNNDTAKLFYEPLYLILHLLPEHLWNEPNSQDCIRFLRRQLSRLAQKKQQLLYVNDLN